MSTIRALSFGASAHRWNIAITGAVISAVIFAFGIQAAQARSGPPQYDDITEKSDYASGRDFIKAAVFGIGPMTDDVASAVADPEFDAFLETRVDTKSSNAELNRFLASYDASHTGLIANVGAASSGGDPYLLDQAVTSFLENLPSALESKTKKKNQVSPETAHARAVVPLAVALAAYMYVAVAHTAAAAVQVGGGFAYYVYSKVKFWGVNASEASQIQHEEYMVRLAEGMAK